MLKKEEGGRHKPFFTGYRPQMYIRTTDVTGTVELPEGVEMVMPGDNVEISVKLISPVAMEKGMRFAIREGGRTIGAGTISGLMGTTSSVGGPPLALVYQKQMGPRIRGTLAVIFIFGAIISIISLAIIGRFGLKEIQAGVILFPGIIVGFLLSSRTARILDRGFTRPAVLLASSISGIIVILRNLL